MVSKVKPSPGHTLETSWEFSHSNHYLLLLLVAFRGKKTAQICWSRNRFLCNNSILAIWQATPCVCVFALWRVSMVSIYNVLISGSSGQPEVLKLESKPQSLYPVLSSILANSLIITNKHFSCLTSSHVRVAKFSSSKRLFLLLKQAH